MSSRAGPLSPRKGINVTWARPELPAITPEQIERLKEQLKLQGVKMPQPQPMPAPAPAPAPAPEGETP